MQEFRWTHLFPLARETVFQLLADIEAYPRLIAPFRNARIVRRDGNRLYVEQVVMAGAMPLRFGSTALLEPPVALTIVTDETSLGRAEIRWELIEMPNGGCRAEFRVRLGAGALIPRWAVARVWKSMGRQIMEGFARSLEAHAKSPFVM